MTSISDPNNPGLDEYTLQSLEANYGYHLKRVTQLETIRSILYEWEHRPTGARHIHISRDDKENTFGVAFKTVPKDSTGVAHILEHTALCGSKRFPVRDPFFSMLRRSLSTFMNAFTASDWTMYPFSTQNPTDYYNLMDVYLDAAFFPRLDKLSFKQEGHRLEISQQENGQWELEFKGVVYNEMKGAMSSPDQILARSLCHALYPDTTYQYNSGGDPDAIPDLTYDQLIAFHRVHYHPSNARFYSYGNLPIIDHLKFIHERVLSQFEAIDPKTDVAPQPRWQQPRSVKVPYPLGKHEDPSRKGQICLAWLTPDVTDTYEVFLMTLLEQILLGNPGSPLRKALIDSGLGSSLSDATGFDPDFRDTMFVCGLKDVAPTDQTGDIIEQIVFDVLNQLVRDGIDAELIESAIHQIEFHRKEVVNTPYPFGLRLLLTFCGSWLHGSDPVRILDMDADLQRLRQDLVREPLFENRIRTWFLENNHRVRFLLYPDQQLQEQQIQRETQKLSQIKAGLSEEQIKQIREDMIALEALQESEEDVSVLPFLDISEIDPAVHGVAPHEMSSDPVMCYDQPTSGILYVTMAMGLGDIPSDLVPLIPFFSFSLPLMGTQKRNYSEMALLIDKHTGGLGLAANARTQFSGQGQCVPFVRFDAKCLERNIGPTFSILEELIRFYSFSDISRLKHLLLEYRARLETSVVHNGHILAMSLASRGFSDALGLGEMWSGIHQLKTMKRLTEKMDQEDLEAISDNLSRLAKHLFVADNVKMALVGETSLLKTGMDLTLSLKTVMEAGSGRCSDFCMPEIQLDRTTPREGWFTSSSVSFVAQTFPTVTLIHEDAPVLAIISKLLRSLYLHREIREKGGAYGGFAQYNPETGIFGFGSYRDPHILNTLKVYQNAWDFIRSGRFSDQDVKEAILQVCSDIDRPDAPGEAGQKAFLRHLLALTDEMRQQYKQGILATTRQRVMDTVQRYADPDPNRQGIAVISGEPLLKQANERLSDEPLELFPI